MKRTSTVAALVFALLGASSLALADPALDSAVKLYRARRFSEAAVALERIVAAQPQNADACHVLGLALSRAGGDHPLEDALVWLERAAQLAPTNADFLGDYGGTCLQIADRSRSFAYAVRGRDAMEKALALDPRQLDCRDGLMRFYAKAPWPLGDAAEALRQAGQIAAQDRPRGLRACLDLERIFENSHAQSAARDACAAALEIAPGNREAETARARLAGG